MTGGIDYSALIALVAGVVILLTAWLPLVLRRLPLSLPIVALAIGASLSSIPGLDSAITPLMRRATVERLSEIVVIIALMGTGLRIERPWSWRGWRAPARLLLIAMPLTIFAIAALGTSVLGLAASTAMLLGAVLAPTDPVLAADVQVGPPGEGEGGEMRFALTSEAGLNDGLAFPFVLLAMSLATTAFPDVWSSWILVDVAFRIACGAAIGFLAGRLFGWLTFKLPRFRLSKTGDGLVALGMTLIAYAATQLAHGYGFIAVFIAAVTLRAADRGHGFQRAMAGFSEQAERLLMVLVMVIFGGALAGLLRPLEWRDALVGLAVLLVVRPAFGWISLIGVPLPNTARLLIACFGVRGIGTFYYLAYALDRATFTDEGRLGAIAAFTVLASVVLHGVSSTPVMAMVDRRRASRSR
jgi:NhaP-type Na+/H+ or K+/H+ antiporter